MVVLRRIAFRLMVGAFVLFGAATLTFFALQLVPGSTVLALLGGPDSAPTPQVMAEVTKEYDLDRPLVVQYGHYLWRLLHGDLGISYQLHEKVGSALASQLLPTVELAATAAVLALLIAVSVALATAKRARWLRGSVSGLEIIAASMPSFWLGLLLLIVFSFKLNLLPVAGNQGIAALVLPAFTIAIPLAGVLSQVLREGLEEVLDQPFVLTVRTHGLGDFAVRFRHALRHALIPITTMAGWLVGGLLGGAVITETLFSRQGIGRLMLTAVNGKDLPVVMAVVLLSAFVYVIVNLVVDLLYVVIDPRLRTG